MIGGGVQNLLRAAAGALANLADRADDWEAAVDPGGAAHEFAGVDIVGIDFSTSIRKLASHVIQGWDRYRRQVEALRPDHGVWVFGVNAIPFPLTRRPVPPRLLPTFHEEHFQARRCGRRLIEYGSAFYDYFFLALGHAHELGVFDQTRRASVPITISLLCDGFPNGGTYRASDIRPLLDEARVQGVRFKVAGFARSEYWSAMQQFRESLGLTQEELEVGWYETGTPDELTISRGFVSLSHF
jgi:hypothetical protein